MKKLLIYLIILLPFATAVPAHAAIAPLIITEVQTGGATSNQEFIELYNPNSQPEEINDWQLEYISSSGKTTTPITTISGQLAARASMLIAYQDYLDDADVTFSDPAGDGLLAASAGHVRLVDQSTKSVDCIAWGAASPMENCSAIPTPPAAGQSIQRPQTSNTYDPALSLQNLPPSPVGGGFTATPSDDDGSPPPPIAAGLQITELLPNPAPPDTDEQNEFIELYNPTDSPVNLTGYELQTGLTSQYHYVIPSGEIAAHGFTVWYSSQTNVSLSNTASQATLVAPDSTIISQTAPYDTVPEGTTWAWNGSNWQATATPTPGTANVITTPLGQGSGDNTEGNDAPTPCETGKSRNPATGRCKTIATIANAPAACDAGQIRNPDTGRCKKITADSTAPTPCPAGNERNPDTNRCRKIARASTTPAPCKEGYERNPDTNRCRKVTAPTQNTYSSTPKSSNKLTVWLLVAAAVAAVGYAIYEYRNDMQRWYLRIKTQVTNRRHN